MLILVVGSYRVCDRGPGSAYGSGIVWNGAGLHVFILRYGNTAMSDMRVSLRLAAF